MNYQLSLVTANMTLLEMPTGRAQLDLEILTNATTHGFHNARGIHVLPGWQICLFQWSVSS